MAEKGKKSKATEGSSATGKSASAAKTTPKKAPTGRSAAEKMAQPTLTDKPATKRRTNAPAKGTRTETPAAAPVAGVTPEQRWHMISEAAYFRAQARGFAGGDPAGDWLAAEAEVDAGIARGEIG